MWRPVVLLAAIPLAFAIFAPRRACATDGYFDTAWRDSGHFNVDPANTSLTSLSKIIVEPSGKLLLAGQAYYGTADFWWLGELFANGQAVPTFGISNGSGYITSCQLGLGCQDNTLDAFSDALVQPDGNYLVLSENIIAGSLRLTRTTIQAHALDSAGVVGGTGYVDVSGYQINDVQGKVLNVGTIALQSGGKVIAAGSGQYEGVSTPLKVMGVLRLNSNLSLDSSFGAHTDTNEVTFAGGNVIAFDAADTSETAKRVLLQSDGHIVLVGTAGSNVAGHDLAIARLTSDGLADPTFATSGGTDGHKKYSIDDKNPIDVQGVAAALDATGRIIIGFDTTTAPGFAVARVSSDGNTIESLIQALVGCTISKVSAVTLDSAGRILAAGYCFGTKDQFLTLRYRNDTALALDTSFGIGGVTLGWFDNAADIGSSKDTVSQSIVIDASGHPVVGGYTNVAAGKAGIARLTSDLIYTDRFEPPRGCLPPDCN